MQPIVSIIIVNWNTRDLIAECLRSVSEEMALLASNNRISASEIGEIIVVDNASTDGSALMLQQDFPWVQLIENGENIGFAAANNQALSYCHGQYILLLNSDTRVLPGALIELIAFIEENLTTGAVGSRYFNADGSLQPSCYPAPTVMRELWRLFHLDKIYPYGIYQMGKWPLDRPQEVDIVQGAALLLRREIALNLGLFDPDYFMYTEEVDLCHRIRQAGWQIFWIPRSTIIHYGGQSTQQIAQTMFLQLYRSKILYFRKHHGRKATFIYKWVLMFATIGRLLLMPLVWMQSPARRRHSLSLANHYYQLAMALPAM